MALEMLICAIKEANLMDDVTWIVEGGISSAISGSPEEVKVGFREIKYDEELSMRTHYLNEAVRMKCLTMR